MAFKNFYFYNIFSLSLSTFHNFTSCRCLSVSTESVRECVYFVFNCLIFEHRAIFTRVLWAWWWWCRLSSKEQVNKVVAEDCMGLLYLIWCRNGIKLMQIN
jgi:hypothetical protein